VVDVPRVALVHDDPPYGIDFTSERRRGTKSAKKSANGKTWGKKWDRVVGDDAPFDPAPLLALDRPTVLWGGNNFASRLPDSGGWIVWDKKRGGTASQGHKASDAELAWSNIGRTIDLFSFFWDGFRRDGEILSHLHPTQKPIELCSFVYRFAKLKPGALVFVPHGGSGPDLPACRAAGLRLIWCDVEKWCCDTAIARLGAVTRERAAEPVGPLFAPPAQVPA
jgi:site-specific DNA-methyltransferase (adenine-specific)/modification methylase